MRPALEGVRYGLFPCIQTRGDSFISVGIRNSRTARPKRHANGSISGDATIWLKSRPPPTGRGLQILPSLRCGNCAIFGWASMWATASAWNRMIQLTLLAIVSGPCVPSLAFNWSRPRNSPRPILYCSWEQQYRSAPHQYPLLCMETSGRDISHCYAAYSRETV